MRYPGVTSSPASDAPHSPGRNATLGKWLREQTNLVARFWRNPGTLAKSATNRDHYEPHTAAWWHARKDEVATPHQSVDVHPGRPRPAFRAALPASGEWLLVARPSGSLPSPSAPTLPSVGDAKAVAIGPTAVPFQYLGGRWVNVSMPLVNPKPKYLLARLLREPVLRTSRRTATPSVPRAPSYAQLFSAAPLPKSKLSNVLWSRVQEEQAEEEATNTLVQAEYVMVSAASEQRQGCVDGVH